MTQLRTVTLQATDPITCQGGRPVTYKAKTFCYKTKIWPESQIGAQSRFGLTD